MVYLQDRLDCPLNGSTAISVNRGALLDGINYLAGLPKAKHTKWLGIKSHQYSRVSCSWNTAIYFCSKVRSLSALWLRYLDGSCNFN